jgi:hypothetical protein
MIHSISLTSCPRCISTWVCFRLALLLRASREMDACSAHPRAPCLPLLVCMCDGGKFQHAPCPIQPLVPAIHRLPLPSNPLRAGQPDPWTVDVGVGTRRTSAQEARLTRNTPSPLASLALLLPSLARLVPHAQPLPIMLASQKLHPTIGIGARAEGRISASPNPE